MVAPMGLRLSVDQTTVCHIDEAFDFLGWRIQRPAWRSRTGKKAVYTYPFEEVAAFCDGQGADADASCQASNAC